jgi:Tol biopolymer transport system component
VTTSGIAERPAISPDGKYVAYIQHEGDSYSLWTRQIATASQVQIVPPDPGTAMGGATVTPDGSSVDFVRGRLGAGSAELWRVPLLGGTLPKKLIDDVASPPGWSPDRQHLAFLRFWASSTALIVAHEDGSDEHAVAVRHLPAFFVNPSNIGNPSIPPAWSPDGRFVALLVCRARGPATVAVCGGSMPTVVT